MSKKENTIERGEDAGGARRILGKRLGAFGERE